MTGSRYWINRLGKFAPTSNPHSNVPNYGLTLDVATAPWDDETQFDALVAEQVASSLLNGLVGLGQTVARPVEFIPGRGEDANVLDRAWSGAKDAAGHVGNAAAEMLGTYAGIANEAGVDITAGGHYDDYLESAKRQGMSPWEVARFVGKSDFAKAMSDISSNEAVQKAFWPLEKVSEGAATALLADKYAVADGGNPFDIFDSEVWERAHARVREHGINAGEAFMLRTFYDREILDDDARFREMRKNSGFLNFGALAFNATAAWKLDPAVLGAKGLGKVRDMRAGVLATDTSPAAAVIQRDILAQPTRDVAASRAREYTGLADRVRANRALTLWDKSQGLREMALRAKDPTVKNFQFEDFRKLGVFVNANASGSVMAKLMFDVADNDEAWNLVFRAGIGDTSAIPELHALEQGIADKINAIELGPMPTLEADFKAVSDRFEARLKEQGGRPGVDDRLIITNARDYFLDEDYATARARLDEARAELNGYREYESWLTRAATGTRKGEGTKVNTVFNALDRVGAKTAFGNPAFGHREALGRIGNQSLYALRGGYSTFRNDEFGRVSRFATAPAKPFLRRTGWADLTNVDEGSVAVLARLDQIAYFAGKKDPNLRNHVLGRWAGTTSETDRWALAEQLDEQGVEVVFNRHGITNPDVRRALIDHFKQGRGKGLSQISDKRRYSTVYDEKGRRLDYFEYVDEKGVQHSIQTPLDPTELPNWYPFINLTDLDRAISVNKHRFAEMDTEANRLAALGKFGAAEAKRLLSRGYNDIGESFNTYWKPAALFSLRWPARVVSDETLRVILFIGASTYMETAGQGARNIMHNTGLTRPFEWARGRIVKTGIAEDTLRVGTHAYDPHDMRALRNPQAGVPADAGLFDGADEARHAKLLEQAAEGRTFLRKGQMGAKPRWAQRFEDRVAALEGAEARGFFFDPVNNAASRKGYAVSVYPGRMRSFERKPSSAELHWWMEKNSDLLSISSNKVAVWLDKDTGRWHLDVVRHARKREDAKVLAAKAGADDFFDVSEGFTRLMRDEDPHGHAAFAAKGPEEAPALDSPVEAAPKRQKRKVGVGYQQARTADGAPIEYEDVYGPDLDNLNIFHSAHSSRGAFDRIFTGYAKGLGEARAKRSPFGPRVIGPGAADDVAQREAWAHAQSMYVNRHFRQSPIWRRMLAGQTDEQIEQWLKTPAGRQVAARMGKRAMHPGQWVEEMRLQFDHVLPTDEARLAASKGDITPEQWDDLIPHEVRNDIHGDDITLTEGSHEAQTALRRFVDKWMNRLATMPTDQLVRHPFGAMLYNQRMRNLYASVEADSITPEMAAAFESSSRAYATKTISRLLYNMADEVEAMHMLRFLSPFIQAQIEVLERYAHLFTTKPEALVRFGQMYYLSQQGDKDKGLWYMVDKDGNPTDKFSHDNKMVIQNTDFVRALTKRIPGLKALDGGNIRIPVSSIDLVFQGERPWIPSAGPLATIPATELYYKDRPWAADEKTLEGQIFRAMFPFGTPQGKTFAGRVASGLLPAWMKRLKTVLSDDFDDGAFATHARRRFTDLQHEWEMEHGRPLPKGMVTKLEEQAHEQTRAWWLVRAISSFSLPVPLEAGSPYQFWYDEAAKFRRRYGIEADEKFYDKYGPDFFKFFQEASKANISLAPTSGASRAFRKFQPLIKQAPELASVIVGPKVQAGEFNYEAYNWQFRTRVGGDLSKGVIRDRPDPEDSLAENQVNRGWIEYGKLTAAVDAELRRMGLVTSAMTEAQQSAAINRSEAEELLRWKQAKIDEIIERNPAWQTAFNSRTDRLSDWLNQADAVIHDKSLDGRTDIEGLRAYMISREKVQAVLQERLRAGFPGSLTAEENADVAAAWDSYVEELTSKNPMFAEIYNRYLETDDLSVLVTN